MRLVIVALLTLISISVSAQFKFIPKGSIEYSPYHAFKIKEFNSDHGRAYYFSPLSTQMGFEVSYKNKISVYTNQILYMDINSISSYQPTLGEWFIGVTYSPLPKVKFKIEHLCVHPIKTDVRTDQKSLYGGYNKISVSYNM